MKIVLRAPRLYDGVRAESLHDAVLTINEDRIEAIGQGPAAVTGNKGERVQTIDVPDGTILPGFIEAHVHMHCEPAAALIPAQVLSDSDQRAVLRASRAVRTLVASGVTSARDIGSVNAVAFAVRDAIRDGIILGPRLLVSGAPITSTGGHFWYMGNEADTEDEVRHAFRRQVKLGADFIKIMVTGGNTTPGTNARRAQFGLGHMRAAVDEGRRLNKQIVAHCHATEGIANAAHAGVNTIVHCSWLAEHDGTLYDESAAEQILEKGIYLDPTLAVGQRMRERAQADPEALARLEPSIRERNHKLEILRNLWERGARLITGTDSGMPDTAFADWALSAQLFVRELGLSAADAIAAATRVSAEALGILHETGTLEPGKLADAVIVRGDPAANISCLFDVDTVILSGRVVKRGGAMLA